MILDFNFFTKFSSYLYFSISSQITLCKGYNYFAIVGVFCSIGVVQTPMEFLFVLVACCWSLVFPIELFLVIRN